MFESIKSNIVKDYLETKTIKVLSLKQKIIKSKSPICRIIRKRKYNKLLFELQSFLPLSKDISNEITFPHGLCGVFISQGAKIEKGCVIFQQVTIGSNALPDSKNKGYPNIGKNCYIGAGAKIIGNVKIGNNVRIGANTVVTKDVEDNTTVVGAKSRLIKHDDKLDNRFIVYKDEK